MGQGTAYHGITVAAKLPPATRTWFQPDLVKTGKSAVRYAVYRQAGTIGEFRALSDPAMATGDLKWDLVRGHAWLLPPADMAYAPWFAGTPRWAGSTPLSTDRRRAWRTRQVAKTCRTRRSRPTGMAQNRGARASTPPGRP